nr:NinE family protein [Atlantibacter hermannii]
MIFRVITRTKRKPEPNPSDIKSFPYTAHLTQVKWDRMRARKRHD